MGHCRCCNEGCCQCDRLIEYINMSFNGVDYNIPLNKTLKEIDCFYPIYFGDAVSTWRYELVSGSVQYVRSFYKSVEILIDFKDPAFVEEFTVVECQNSPSTYAMHEGEIHSSRYYKLFWGDERFLDRGSVVLKYKGKIFTLSLTTGFATDAQIAEILKNQIIQFGELYDFQELIDCDVIFTRVNLTPGSSLLADTILTSSRTLEQYAKDRYVGVQTNVTLLWTNYTCPSPIISTIVTGSGVHSTNLSWSSEAIPETVIGTGQYTTSILGFYITLTYDGSSIIIESTVNYLDENETIEDFFIRNDYDSLPYQISYNTTRTACGSGIIANGTGGGCAGGAQNVGQTPGNL